MGSYILRKLDEATWDQFKARAARDGHSLKYVILQFIAFYIRHGLPTAVHSASRKSGQK